MKVKWMSRIKQRQYILIWRSHFGRAHGIAGWITWVFPFLKKRQGVLTPEFWGCWPGLCFDFHWPDILRGINQTQHSPGSRKGVDSTNAFPGYVLQNRWGKAARILNYPVFPSQRLSSDALSLCCSHSKGEALSLGNSKALSLKRKSDTGELHICGFVNYELST